MVAFMRFSYTYYEARACRADCLRPNIQAIVYFTPTVLQQGGVPPGSNLLVTLSALVGVSRVCSRHLLLCNGANLHTPVLHRQGFSSGASDHAGYLPFPLLHAIDLSPGHLGC